ncbi:MAG: hypothetical protein ACI8UO_005411 [Verrucomicrobiales bacterium]|jgi:hypothetical protein
MPNPVHLDQQQEEREAFLAQVLAGETDYSSTNEEIEEAMKWDMEFKKEDLGLRIEEDSEVAES